MWENSPWEGSRDSKLGSLACIGKIVAVNTVTRTCRCKTLGSFGKTDDLDLHDVRILHNMWHPQGDEETYIPRVGSYAVILFVNSEPFIVGYIALPNQDNTAEPGSNYQENLVAGDKTIATIAGNRISLRSGGAVTIESTKFCRTLFLPTRNLISTVCENHETYTSGGRMLWTNLARTANEKEDHTRFDLVAWDNLDPERGVRLQLGSAEDTMVPFRMEIGGVDDDRDIVDPGVVMQGTDDGQFEFLVDKRTYSQVGTEDGGFYAQSVDADQKQMSFSTPSGHLVVFDDSDADGSISVIHRSGALIQFTKDGKFIIQTSSGNTISYGDDDVTIASKDGSVITASDKITLVDKSGSQILAISEDGIQITAAKDITVSAPKVAIAGGAIDLGDNPSFHAVIYEMMKDVFDNHIHLSAAGSTTPPMPPNTFALTENIPPLSAKADYVKLRGNLTP